VGRLVWCWEMGVGLKEVEDVDVGLEGMHDFGYDFGFDEACEERRFVDFDIIQRVCDRTEAGSPVRAWLVLCFADFITLDNALIKHIPQAYLHDTSETYKILHAHSPNNNNTSDAFPLSPIMEEQCPKARMQLREEFVAVAKGVRYCLVRMVVGVLRRGERGDVVRRVVRGVVGRLDFLGGVTVIC